MKLLVPEPTIVDLLIQHCSAEVLGTLTYEDLRVGKDLRHTMADVDDFLEAFQGEVLKCSPHEVFLKLIEVMEIDNGCTFTFTRSQQQRAMPLIRTLQDAGFFAENDHLDLTSSYWMAGAGESTEAPEYFGKTGDVALTAFRVLNVILDDIFDMPLAEHSEKPSGGKRRPPLIELSAGQIAQLAMFAGDGENEPLEDQALLTISYESTGHSGPGIYSHYTDLPEEGYLFLDGTWPSKPKHIDTLRVDFLDEMVNEACVSSCFEWDGGVHLTIERPSSEPEAYRDCNTLRQAIDLAIRHKENSHGQ